MFCTQIYKTLLNNLFEGQSDVSQNLKKTRLDCIYELHCVNLEV